MSAIKSVFKLISPSFYRQQWREYISDLSKDVTAGRPQPFFKAILLIGVVGYTMEYTQVGRYHVIEKQNAIKEALKNHHH